MPVRTRLYLETGFLGRRVTRLLKLPLEPTFHSRQQQQKQQQQHKLYLHDYNAVLQKALTSKKNKTNKQTNHNNDNALQ